MNNLEDIAAADDSACVLAFLEYLAVMLNHDHGRMQPLLLQEAKTLPK